MAFTASALQEAQYRLAEMDANPNTAQPEDLEGSATTAAALIRRQTARTVERATGGKTVGWEAWFFRPAARTCRHYRPVHLRHPDRQPG